MTDAEDNEIEYKFLVARDDWKKDVVDSKPLTQVYLDCDPVTTEEGPVPGKNILRLGRIMPCYLTDRQAEQLAGLDRRTVRVRLLPDETKLTIKGRPRGPSAPEIETTIDRATGLALIDAYGKTRLGKTRHIVPAEGDLVWEIDVYDGDLEGLVTAEIEVNAVDQAFDRPPWIGDDITHDLRYKNESLARDGLPANGAA